MKNLTIKIGDYTFETFREILGAWRWRCRARNGEKVCTSGESFASKGNAERAMRDFIENVRVPIQEGGEFWNRIEEIKNELSFYAYGKMADGERFPEWDEVASAYAALNRVIERHDAEKESKND